MTEKSAEKTVPRLTFGDAGEVLKVKVRGKMLEKLDWIAFRDNKTRSDALREAIALYLAAKEI